VTNNPLAITTANGKLMYSTHTAELNIPYLPSTARYYHVVPKLGQYSLVSIGQLCDADCDVLFQCEIMTVSYKNTVIMQGRRMRSTGLWHLGLNHHDGSEKFPPVPCRSIRETIAKGESISNLPPRYQIKYTVVLHVCDTLVDRMTYALMESEIDTFIYISSLFSFVLSFISYRCKRCYLSRINVVYQTQYISIALFMSRSNDIYTMKSMRASALPFLTSVMRHACLRPCKSWLRPCDKDQFGTNDDLTQLCCFIR
jgi:hypothetical protein